MCFGKVRIKRTGDLRHDRVSLWNANIKVNCHEHVTCYPPPSYKSNWDTLNENLRHLGPIFLIWDIRFLGLATDLKIDVSHHGITRYKMYCPPLPNVLRKFGDFVQ